MSKHEIEVVDADEVKITEQSTSLLDPKIAAYFAVITSDKHLEECATSIRAINGARKFIKTVWDHACSEANRLHKSFTSHRNGLDNPLEEARRVRTLACKLYVHQKEHAAELIRAEAEMKARQEAEAARAEQAKALEQNGDAEAAQAVAAADVTVYVPPAAPVAKPIGITLTKYWKFKVVDLRLIPHQYMTPNMVTIGDFAREHKAAAVMPGVEFYCE